MAFLANDKMRITNWPVNERSRGKLIRQGTVERLRNYPREVFACLFLDNQHRVLKFEELFHGTIDKTSAYPRKVIKKALELNAAALILAHCPQSPIGQCTPQRNRLAPNPNAG